MWLFSAGVVDKVAFHHRFDLMVSKVFSNLTDFVNASTDLCDFSVLKCSLIARFLIFQNNHRI